LLRAAFSLDEIQRPAVGTGDRLRGDDDLLEQRVEIRLARERRSDFVEPIEPADEILRNTGVPGLGQRLGSASARRDVRDAHFT
jgi:hypothetical protein